MWKGLTGCLRDERETELAMSMAASGVSTTGQGEKR